MLEELLCSIDPQTTFIGITISPRARGTQPNQLNISVVATKSKVLHGENGEVLGVLGSETRPLSNVVNMEAFPATYAALKAEIDAEFAPPSGD
jgi:hypothetical protein